MLTISRAFRLPKGSTGRALPRIPELSRLYAQYGVRLTHGSIIMIAGRSGSGKSSFALWLAMKMGLETMYFSADMSQATASAKAAALLTGDTVNDVHSARQAGEEEKYVDALKGTQMVVSHGAPITWQAVDQNIEAYVEVFDRFPELFIFDNLMDFEDAEADYQIQMEVMQRITELARQTGSTVMVLHHATDKGGYAPSAPPARAQIKNGLSEKPEYIFGVGLDPNTNEFGVAVLKQREGKSDPSGQHYVSLRADPERNRYDAF